MKKAFLLGIALIFTTVSGYAQHRSLTFENGSFAEVLAKAKAENKPVLLDAYTTWCAPCKLMDRKVFTNDSVADFYNARFIACKMDMERGEGLTLVKPYQVIAYPTFLFISPEGLVMHRAVGYMKPRVFVEAGKTALNPDQNFSGFQKRYDGGDQSPEFLTNFIRLKQANFLDYTKELAEYYAQQKEDKLLTPANWKMLTAFTRSPEAPEFKRFLQHREAFSKAFARDSVDKFILKIYEQTIENALHTNKQEVASKAKSELIELKVKNADKAIWELEIPDYSRKGDLKNYTETVVKLIDTYYPQNAGLLNEYAWAFNQRVTDKVMLAKAEAWAARAVALQPVYSNLYTYAALLYKLGKKDEARRAAENAIATGKKTGDNVTKTERLLQKINELK